MKYDSDVQRNVQDALSWEPGITDSSKIGVAVKNGVVTLTGVVNSYAEKWLAETAAKGVYGVNGLAVDLEVNLPSSAKRTDADIAQAAKNILDWDSSIPVGSVQVTAGGAVPIGKLHKSSSINNAGPPAAKSELLCDNA
jgi:hypothetical protein